jgi:hypothetical protein
MANLLRKLETSYRNAWRLSALIYPRPFRRALFRFTITALPVAVVSFYLFLGLFTPVLVDAPWLTLICAIVLILYPALLIQFFYNSHWIIKLYEENHDRVYKK